ncbi:MAG: hypothetical protein K0Q65_322 [Clostridia bacterium]|nr:hypothetical protein [Clostridia bacterium]
MHNVYIIPPHQNNKYHLISYILNKKKNLFWFNVSTPTLIQRMFFLTYISLKSFRECQCTSRLYIVSSTFLFLLLHNHRYPIRYYSYSCICTLDFICHFQCFLKAISMQHMHICYHFGITLISNKNYLIIY